MNSNAYEQTTGANKTRMINCLPALSRKSYEFSTINPGVEARHQQAVTSLRRSAEKNTLKTMRPKFDPKEEFLVAYYRSGSASGAGRTWTYDLAVLLVAIGLFAFGFLGDRDLLWCVIGFGLVAYRVVHLALTSSKYDGVFTSIIDKYEAALDDADRQGNVQNTKAEQGGTGQPATRPESKSEGSDKSQHESEGRSR